LLVVSHDRYFLDKLCDHLFVFEGGGRIKDFNGHYYEWREEQKRIDAIRIAQEKAVVANVEEVTKEKVKLSFKERLEWESLPEEIAALEEKRDALNAVFESEDQDPEEVARAATEVKEVLAALDEKEMRWLELAEFADE
jgi:ATP-binding cassette subfamily F protein uup